MCLLRHFIFNNGKIYYENPQIIFCQIATYA